MKNNSAPFPRIDFAVGGQAVIEGVMMRSPNFVTVAVRKLSGEIKLKEEKFQGIGTRIKLLGIPFVRGVVNLFEMMIIGMRMVNFSAAESMEEEPQESAAQKAQAKALQETAANGQKAAQTSAGGVISIVLSLVFALGFSILLFKFIPLYITDFLSKKFPTINDNYLLFNFIDGVIKTSFFVVYIGLLGLTKSMHRVFQYHGAEHKSIFTYEKGLELTVENAKKQIRFHPRCGTSFIMVVFLLSIFIYTFVPRQPDFLMNFSLRLLFLPLIAGVSYEVLKWSAKYSDHSLVKLVTFPGLMFQRLTTQEPDDQQLEVALSSLKRALELEKIKLAPALETAVDVP